MTTIDFASSTTHANCNQRILSVECLGTEHGFQDRFASSPQERIPFYRSIYENCTTVTKNLEIVHLYPGSGSEFDLSFIENIREVYGYVLVATNHVSRVPLTSLRVIRGLVQLKPQSNGVGYSLYIAANYHQPRAGVEVGLRVLELPSLRGRRLLCIR